MKDLAHYIPSLQQSPYESYLPDLSEKEWEAPERGEEELTENELEELFLGIDKLYKWWHSQKSPSTHAFNLQKAISYNRRKSKSLGWGKHKRRIYILLGFAFRTPSETQFAKALAKWQRKKGFRGKDVDGRLGPATWRKMKPLLGLKGAGTTSSTYIGLWKNVSWDRAALKGVKELGTNLLTVIPRDMNEFCPKYPFFSQNKKMRFWVVLLSAMAKFESGFRPETKYKESFGPISRGLLQISLSSANQARYQAPGPNRRHVDILRTEQDLHDPEKNLRAGIRILNYWVGQHKYIGGSYKKNNKWRHRGGAKYWSVLRSKNARSADKLNKIKQLVRQSGLCQ